jgi:tetratricopeptide (TPR) repeat protein
MEILKKITLGLAFATVSFGAVGQDEEAKRGAFKMSYISEAQAKYSKAIEDLTAVYDAKSYEINVRIAFLHYLNRTHQESVKYYKIAIALMPMSIEAKLGCSLPLSSLQKWTEVIEQYSAILKIDEYHAITNYRMSLYYYNAADYAKAWIYISKYINLYPFDFDGTSLAGWIKHKDGKKDEAKVLFQKALLIKPGNADINAVLGIKK